MDFFGAGIPLGRWFRIQVVLHWLFVLYVAVTLMNSKRPAIEATFMAVLFATILVHEFGHALTCRWVGGEAHRIVLWPLGGLAFVQPPPRPLASLATTVGGPITHLPMGAIWFVLAEFVAPKLTGVSPDFREQLILVSQFGVWINLMLLIFNLIPAYPMDGGRILQELLWLGAGYQKSLQITGMIGTVAGGALAALGLGVARISIPWIGYQAGIGFFREDYSLGGGGTNGMLVVIGFMCAMESFAIYRRSQEVSSWRKQ